MTHKNICYSYWMYKVLIECQKNQNDHTQKLKTTSPNKINTTLPKKNEDNLSLNMKRIRPKNKNNISSECMVFNYGGIRRHGGRTFPRGIFARVHFARVFLPVFFFARVRFALVHFAPPNLYVRLG